MRTVPESGVSSPIMILSRHALAGSTASQNGQGLAAVHRQADPVQDRLNSETIDAGRRQTTAARCSGFLCVDHREIVRLSPYVFLQPLLVYGKKMMMNFTSTTSARITNNEDNTTELVAARPTPAAPPRVRIP